MALGEQFGSREIVYGPEGNTGTRVWLMEYADRKDASVPSVGDQWSPAADATLDSTEALWVHAVARRPYGASSATAPPLTPKAAATDTKIEIRYESSRVNLVDKANWIISSRPALSATPLGAREFSDPTHKVDVSATGLRVEVEITIEGEEDVQGWSQGDLSEPSYVGLIGKAGNHFWLSVRAQARVPGEPSEILFLGQENSEPYYREAVGGWWRFRRFTRH